MTFELLAEDMGGEPGRLDYVSDVEKRENLITSGQTKQQWCCAHALPSALCQKFSVLACGALSMFSSAVSSGSMASTYSL